MKKNVSKDHKDWLIVHESKEKFLKRMNWFDALLVCQEKRNPVGVVGLEAGEIKCLYILPNQQRKGIGSILLKVIEARARKQGWISLRVTANPNAVPFYEKHGFHTVKKTTIRDTYIKIELMEKRL